MKELIIMFSLSFNLILTACISYFIFEKGGLNLIKRKMGVGQAYQDSGFGPYYDQRRSLFESIPAEKGDILFIGHSIADGCEWAELFQNPKIKNRGINGENTEGLLKRLHTLTKPTPSKIFIITGANDIGKNQPSRTFMVNFQKIIDSIKSACPETKIFLMSLLPSGADGGDDLTPVIVKFNAGLQNIAKTNQCTYIDLFGILKDEEGKFDMEYTNDGWHLMGKGYLKIRDALKPYVN